MKYGIYYAYWEKEWVADYVPYIQRVKKLGFDILEVACGDFHERELDYFDRLHREAESCGIILTGGYGPRPEHNIASPDTNVVRNAFAFYEDIFPKMQRAGISSIGGGLYSYWPVNFSEEIDKENDYERSVAGMKKLADIASNFGISLNMEVLNRFEGYLLNDAAEGLKYVQDVGKPNVKVMLDTFHMNIEEDCLIEAIRLAGKYLGELHIGEANRKPPRQGRMPWAKIAGALNEIGYDGPVVMEPFVMMGGKVGSDIKVWRDISNGADAEMLDNAAAASVDFIRKTFEGSN